MGLRERGNIFHIQHSYTQKNKMDINKSTLKLISLSLLPEMPLCFIVKYFTKLALVKILREVASALYEKV